MIIDFHNRGGGGGGTADYATSAGTSNSTKLLEGETNFPQSGNTGDVVAIGSTPTRGTKAPILPSTGIYQYDGSSWNKVEAGSGSSAYKIELSAVNPEDYTSADTATLDTFYAAFDADNTIADSAYISASDGIYRCVRYSTTPQFSIFTFEGLYNNNIVTIWLGFVNGSYSSGNMQNAVPTPNFTILKSVSQLPASAETGDVVAVLAPPQEGTWEVFDASASPTKVRIMTKSDGTYLLHFSENNLYTGLDYAAGDPPTFSGSGWGLQQDDTYEWHYDNDGYYIKVWVEQEGDDWYIYADMTQGEGGFSTLDAYGLGSESQMLVGETDGDIGVYQKYEKDVETEITCAEVSFPNGYEDGDRWVSSNLLITIHEWPSDAKIVTNAEFLGSRYYFEVGNADNQVITVYDDNNDTVAALNDGDTYNFTMQAMGYDVLFSCSLSNGVFSGEAQNMNLGWENTVWTVTETRVETEDSLYKLATTEDLPAKINLVPDGEPNYGFILRYNSVPEWVHPSDIKESIFVNIPTKEGDDYPTVLTREGEYDFYWEKSKNNILRPVDNLPVQSEDAVVYAESSWGIVQAQGSHSETDWFNYNGKEFPQGVVTKIRFPYSDDGESNICNFKTDPNGSGNACLYWHPEDPNDRHFDGVPEGYSQNDGEFNAVDAWGNTMVGTKVGDYIEVTFGAPLYDGDDKITTYRNTEAYNTDDVTDYANAVMSFDIKRMVKITQADYDDLVLNDSVEPDTMYLIITPQV